MKTRSTSDSVLDGNASANNNKSTDVSSKSGRGNQKNKNSKRKTLDSQQKSIGKGKKQHLEGQSDSQDVVTIGINEDDDQFGDEIEQARAGPCPTAIASTSAQSEVTFNPNVRRNLESEFEQNTVQLLHRDDQPMTASQIQPSGTIAVNADKLIDILMSTESGREKLLARAGTAGLAAPQVQNQELSTGNQAAAIGQVVINNQRSTTDWSRQDTGKGQTSLPIHQLTISASPSQDTIYTQACRTASDVNQPELPNFNEPLNSSGDSLTDGRIAGPGQQPSQEEQHNETRAEPPQQREVERLILEAERAKGDITRPPGKITDNCDQSTVLIEPGHSSLTPMPRPRFDKYTFLAHVDKSLKTQAEQGMFVDLNRLLPRECIEQGDATRLELTSREGHTYYVPPVSEKDAPCITGFVTWEKAFQVYMGLYLRANPSRSLQMLQYINKIRSAAATFVWYNVENYDIIHRQLMEEDPTWNWGHTYQDAWNEEMKKRLPEQPWVDRCSKGGNQLTGGKAKKPICIQFNKNGKCKFGEKC